MGDQILTRRHDESVLVEFKRGLYSHWAVYLGNEEVVHLVGVDNGASDASFTSSASSFSICGVKFNKTEVRIEGFWEVAKGSRARINNSQDEKWSTVEYPNPTRSHIESILSNLNVGDLVEFPRFFYSHWAVYLGNETVVYLVGVDNGASGASFTSSASSFSTCGVLFNKTEVRIEGFWEVAKGSTARKNNSKDEKWSTVEDPNLTRSHIESIVSNLNVGDLVEFPRFFYSHWAVYLGNETVVHLVGVDNGASGASFTSSASSFSTCGVLFNKTEVRIEGFWEVTKGSKARKNNSKDEKWRPLSTAKIVENALSKLGDDDYNLFFSNCEHYATWSRYGISQSDQVEQAMTRVAGTAVGLLVALIIVLLIAVARYFKNDENEQKVNQKVATKKMKAIYGF